jgi:hypothetical protein
VATLAKVTAAHARDICALASAGGFELPPPSDSTPAQYVGELIAANNLGAAVQFLAFALPPREAVWWACTCARLELREPAAQAVRDAVDAAETWVRRPTDENRRAAMARAQDTKFDSPSAWAAVAAFWSGGSMAPPNLPEVPPAPHLLGVAVTGAVTLAAVQLEPQSADEKNARFLSAAVDIANGGTGRPKPGA